MAYLYTPPPVIINNELEKRMADIFLMYDFVGDQTVDSINTGTILRFLGCVPSDEDICQFNKLIQFEKSEVYVHLSKFLPELYKLLVEDKMRPATVNELQEAFKILDPNEDGYIDKNSFVAQLSEIGDHMTGEEFKTMLSVSMDNFDGKFYYEPYVIKILSEKADSIYVEAKAMEAKKLAQLRAIQEAKEKKAAAFGIIT